MPIKWTPERDQTLLVKILETSSVSVDAKKVSEAWPASEEAPTARAISERIFKIRSKNKDASKGDASGSVEVHGGREKSATPKKAKASGTKRKHVQDDEYVSSSNAHSFNRTVLINFHSSSTDMAPSIIKPEGSDSGIENEKPKAKKVRAPPKAKLAPKQAAIASYDGGNDMGFLNMPQEV
ncbi:MAG: hypothetical protein Q9220_002952 [cf. Caloplaca sp. 1 TL-2023]